MDLDPTTLQQQIDPFGRVIDYLRISITDRCNERCLYCMPEGYTGWSQRQDHLTADEIVATVEAAISMGFRKFRITGGEPLIRADAVEILERIRALPGTQTVGVSTNATRLATLAPALKKAGVCSINISLDALDPARYRAITGGDLGTVLQGIEASLAQNFELIKLNCVLLRGWNEEDYFPLIDFAAERSLPIRFIELMPLSSGHRTDDPRFLPVQEVMVRLQSEGELIPCENLRIGHGPARYFQFKRPGHALARIGLIGALSEEHFCANCNKIRLTADGKLRPCLGRHGEIDLLASLRAGRRPEEALHQAIANKPEKHAFLEDYAPGRPMTAIGG
jgi:cyclic pyranopterin phosphate synthase